MVREGLLYYGYARNAQFFSLSGILLRENIGTAPLHIHASVIIMYIYIFFNARGGSYGYV
jgi:hypothetical protein